MKKTLTFLLAFVLCLSMVACGQTDTPETTPDTQPDLQALYTEFTAELAVWDVITYYPRLSLREDGSAFLMTDIVNNSQSILMSADVYFAAFDEKGEPVSLVNNTSSEFVKAAKLPDIFLEPGETWQANMGLRLTEGFEEIAYVVAIVDNYTDLEQNTVSNPLVDTWMDYYNGETLADYTLAQLRVDDPSRHYEAFLAQVHAAGAVADNPQVIHEEKTSTLVADLFNGNTDKTITGATLLFAAFDAQGNPVQLLTDATEDAYVKRLELSDLSIAPGETWQADMGLRLSGVADQIAHVFVLAETWTTEDGVQENSSTDPWLEYFSETTLASYILEN